MVFGSNPVDLCWREDKDRDSAFAQDTSLSGQSVQHWELRMMAQEAALEEIAYSRIRRRLARSESVACADVNIGAAALLCNAQGKKRAARRRGLASILDIGGVGATGRRRGFARERGGVRKARRAPK